MSGEASYTDAEVKKAMGLWKDLVDAGCFAANSNANDWTDASDQVARGDAAMTLMGTWITGYWNGQGLKPGDRLRLLRVPDDRPTACRTPWSARSTASSSPPMRRNPEGAQKLARLARLRPGGAGQVGGGPGRAVAERQGRRRRPIRR